ncbi:MAG: serine/threonine-protein phosphatase, partial [Marmoricola sp.]|nr:serine/threonine-protein phosphatase [Marmoricola sp.]
ASALASTGTAPLDALGSGVQLAQRQLALGVRERPERTGMATTLTAVATDGRRVALVHVGDSRGYLWRDGALRAITRDHTFVQRLVDEGTLAADDVRSHPWRNVVLRSLDGDVHETGDLGVLDLAPGDRVLLASDGLTDLVSTERIAAYLRVYADDREAVDGLVRAALDAGGKDNVTCVLATVVEGAPVPGDGVLLGAARDPRTVVDPAAVQLRPSA